MGHSDRVVAEEHPGESISVPKVEIIANQPGLVQSTMGVQFDRIDHLTLIIEVTMAHLDTPNVTLREVSAHLYSRWIMVLAQAQDQIEV